MQAHENMMTLIFRNRGQAGASLHHPHSQVIMTGIVPQAVRWRKKRAQYFDEWGCVVCCDILAFEMQDRQRVILENQSLLPSFLCG